MTLEDVETAAGIVQEAANPDANIIFGAAWSDALEDEMQVTVIATGFEEHNGAVKPTESKKTEDKPQAKPRPTEDVDDIDEIFKIFNR